MDENKELKEKRIKKEEAKLKKMFETLSDDTKKLCEGLIQNAAFMYVTLNELQEEIKEKGAVLECTSGNGFRTVKDNPAYKAYTTLISRYTVVMKQLNDLLPTEEERAGDELLDFIRNN